MQILEENKLLRSITRLYEHKEKMMQSEAVILSMNQDIEVIASFLGLDKNYAPLIAVMICEQLIGENSPYNRLMKLMGYSAYDIVAMERVLKGWVKKRWIRSKRHKYSGRSMSTYEFEKRFMDAIHFEDVKKLADPHINDPYFAMLELKKKMQRYLGEFEFDELTTNICEQAAESLDIRFIAHILKDEQLIDPEKAVMLWLGVEWISGKEEFDFEQIIEMFTQDPSYVYWFKKRLKSGESKLLSNGLIQMIKPDFSDFSLVRLGEELVDMLQEVKVDTASKTPALRYSKLLEPDNLPQQQLFFNKSMEVERDRVEKMLTEPAFSDLMLKFKENGFPMALTMLFHGQPGTGKTALAHQLAKFSNRFVCQVDISNIRDMWVGESEKNLKRVFKEYAYLSKKTDNIPILLFNEADAIFGVRTSVATAVDQMNNSLQNILLQELEDFEGIFIATTNLIKNIDAAFDRRLVYKLHFELPDLTTASNILNNEFTGYNPEFLGLISQKYRLSGGQISNVKRKLLTESLLQNCATHSEELLIEFLAKENGFRNRKTNIGFK